MKAIVCAIIGAALVYLAFGFTFLSLNPSAWGDNETRALCTIYMAMAAGFSAVVAAMSTEDLR
jgi:hypothetical protein